MTVCAAPQPMQEEVVRQLLALDMSTGQFNTGGMMSTDSVIQSGVGLITFDQTEQLILPSHDSVRQFIFSEAARFAIDYLATFHKDSPDTSSYSSVLFTNTAIPKFNERNSAGYSMPEWCERRTRLHLGAAFLLHIQQRTSRSLILSSARSRREIPTMAASIPGWMQSVTKPFLPHASNRKTVSVSIQGCRKASQRDGLLMHGIDNWIACNQDVNVASLDAPREQSELFASIALERNESWKIHPWPVMAPSRSQHITGMFAYSIANDHLPLLRLALDGHRSLPHDIFTGLLPNHGHLPALHVACKMGHSRLLPALLKVCNLWTTCSSNRTALHYATEAGHLGCVKELCAGLLAQTRQHSNSYKAYFTWQDADSRTPLDLAILNGHEHFAAVLASEYVYQLLNDQERESLTKLILDQGFGYFIQVAFDKGYLTGLRAIGQNGRSRLMLAAAQGLQKHVQALCPVIEPHLQDETGMTALCLASENGHASVVETLLEFFKDHNQTAEKDIAKSLDIAAGAGKAAVVDALLKVESSGRGLANMKYTPVYYHTVEKAVFGHYYGRSHSLETAKAIVGMLSTSLISWISTRHDGRSPDEQKQRLYDDGTLDIFLRAAAEVGNVNAVQQLLDLRVDSSHTPVQPLPRRRRLKDVELYLAGRGISRRNCNLLNVDDTLFPVSNILSPMRQLPVPTLLAAVREHSGVLALLLPDPDPLRIERVITQARDIDLRCEYQPRRTFED